MRKTKILVVDDESDIKILFEQRFRKEIRQAEFVFLFANSGEEALNVLSKNFHEAILILSDINMPGMNGWEFLDAYKKLPEDQTRHIKVLMLTTSINPDEEKKAIDIPEVKGFIHKPLTPEKLEKAINVYIF